MAVTDDILATWRRPRRVMRRLLDMGRREDRALIFLMIGCLLIFVAQWPPLQRAAIEDPSVPLDARIGGALLGWLLWMPLIAYALGAASHLIAKIFGGQGSWYSARLALFWTLLATAPIWLLNGMVAGYIGPGPAQNVTGAILAFSVLGIWGMTLWEAEQAPEEGAPHGSPAA